MCFHRIAPSFQSHLANPRSTGRCEFGVGSFVGYSRLHTSSEEGPVRLHYSGSRVSKCRSFVVFEISDEMASR